MAFCWKCGVFFSFKIALKQQNSTLCMIDNHAFLAVTQTSNILTCSHLHCYMARVCMPHCTLLFAHLIFNAWKDGSEKPNLGTISASYRRWTQILKFLNNLLGNYFFKKINLKFWDETDVVLMGCLWYLFWEHRKILFSITATWTSNFSCPSPPPPLVQLPLAKVAAHVSLEGPLSTRATFWGGWDMGTGSRNSRNWALN